MSFLSHSLYTQTGNFAFQASLSFDTITGHSEFGFSGDSSAMGFSFISGKIFDWNQNFVGIYDQTAPTTVSGTIGVFTADYYIGSESIAFGINRPTGYFNKIYAVNRNENFNLNLSVQGDMPQYTIQPSSVFNTGDASIPLMITNASSFPFEIFSGNLIGSMSKFSLSSPVTGRVNNTFTYYLVPKGTVSVGLNSVPIDFYTDFGIVHSSVDVSGKTSPFSGLFMEIIGNSLIQNGGVGQFNIHFFNSGTAISVVPYLQYVSGSGIATIKGSGAYHIIRTGFINLSGDISGHVRITGSGYQPDNTLILGIINSEVLGFQWATGFQISPLSILATGLGTGINYSGRATGILNKIVSGHILAGSGSYNITRFFTGIPSSVYSVYPTGFIQSTGAIYYNAPQLHDVLYVYDQSDGIVNGYDYTTIDQLTTFLNTQTNYHVSASKTGSIIYLTSLLSGSAGNFLLGTEPSNVGNMAVSHQTLLGGQDFGIGELLTPISNFTGHFSGRINGTGIYSQRLKGIVFGDINEFKTFSGTWNMKTGITSFINYKASGFLNPNKDTYIYESGKTSSNVNNFFVKILYNGTGTQQDIVNLFASGFNSHFYVNKLISGVK